MMIESVILGVSFIVVCCFKKSCVFGKCLCFGLKIIGELKVLGFRMLCSFLENLLFINVMLVYWQVDVRCLMVFSIQIWVFGLGCCVQVVQLIVSFEVSVDKCVELMLCGVINILNWVYIFFCFVKKRVFFFGQELLRISSGLFFLKCLIRLFLLLFCIIFIMWLQCVLLEIVMLVMLMEVRSVFDLVF